MIPEFGDREDFKNCVMQYVRPCPQIGDRYYLYYRTPTMLFQVGGISAEWVILKFPPLMPGLPSRPGTVTLSLTRFLEQEDNSAIRRA